MFATSANKDQSEMFVHCIEFIYTIIPEHILVLLYFYGDSTQSVLGHSSSPYVFYTTIYVV